MLILLHRLATMSPASMAFERENKYIEWDLSQSNKKMIWNGITIDKFLEFVKINNRQ